MACRAERGRVTRGGSQCNNEPKSKSSDKVRSAGFGPKPPASTHRCGRDHAQSSCGQCRKDRSRSCSVMRPARGAIDAAPSCSDPVQQLRRALTAAAEGALFEFEEGAGGFAGSEGAFVDGLDGFVWASATRSLAPGDCSRV